ncbi:EAL domain-containing protein [Aciduricibacillus chroicocephali]|uniref:EAL domain-containing protein n=1 Tax=Aciduricibacillus chroicocephali TaxID=3054939 RepID=A0ABY9KU21_9BACI|nr:EAL domain-containing protein [Bacillaceae bacterium 44XB]
MIMQGSYNPYIVALSIIIAVLASYSALIIVGKVSYSEGKARIFWLAAGSVVMGSGVWSMHFVGMLSFQMGMKMQHDIALTLTSMAASIFSAFIAFWITAQRKIKGTRIAVGGLVMGSGIITMHYIGMEAMQMTMTIQYDPVWWTISAVIALVASYAALFLFLRFRNSHRASISKWLSSLAMGFAICGMHYSGMKATIFKSKLPMPNVHTGMDNGLDPVLLYGVTVIIFILLLTSWGAMFFERHVLERLAYADSISGLPNRNDMNRHFHSNAGSTDTAVLFLDLDQFKTINDTLNHVIGDKLIAEAGQRLKHLQGEDCEVFRIGGDEFLIVANFSNEMKAKALAEQALNMIERVFHIGTNELYITGSIGISIGKIDEYEHSNLLREAETAMYEAKQRGSNSYVIYNEELGKRKTRKLKLEHDLHQALVKNQLFITYQPQWNVVDNQLSGFESLLRWKHPTKGLVSPAEFIPIAEETGLIIPITKWVIEKACHQARLWYDQGWSQSIAVNLSIRIFQNGQLFSWVEEALGKSGLPPHMLELEITESMVMRNMDDIIRQLEDVRQLGVRISLDDFGTGYSSIAVLDRIPIDCLKLDRLFTNDLETPNKHAIVKGIIRMAKSLKLDIVAEGVEHQEPIDILTTLGCDVMQGYFYGKPMTPPEVSEWLADLKNKSFAFAH